MSKRVFLIVLDSFGIGEMPDAGLWNDEGSNTLGAIRNHENFSCPTMSEMGLFNIEGVGGGVDHPTASFARLTEKSKGKDTTIGHWEIAGLVSEQPFPVYPDGFPEEVLGEFRRRTGREILCNLPYSGTEVIKDYGKEHIESGALIVYTSADSVFQIAAHESVVPVQELYKYCEIAREILQGKHAVGRVIARPFIGEYPNFERTRNRHDFSLVPPRDTMLDLIKKKGLETIAVGKINDIFAGKGITESIHIENNDDGCEKTLAIAERDFEGICFVNLVDFDMVYGHRNDIPGYAKAATDFDRYLKQLLPKLKDDDLLIITADHGCDPATPSTDHSREYVPMLMYGKSVKPGVDLHTRESFADISATILEYFGIDQGETSGKSFLKECQADSLSDEDLIRIAADARNNAYTPYSNYKVGAALLTKSGKVYTGCNIENATFTPTVCAERTAIFKAISEGEKDFAKIAIVGGRTGEVADFCAPCGVCRQVIAEFCDEDFILVLGRPGNCKEYKFSEILPYSFTKKEL